MLPDEARPAPRAGATLLIELAAGKCTSATALPDQVASGCCGGWFSGHFSSSLDFRIVSIYFYYGITYMS